MNIDLRNTTTLTILAIACILVFTCVYVMVIKPNNEGFAESVLAAGDTVRLIDGLRSVIIGSGTSGGNANDYINSMMPAMSIIAYAADTAPNGWQLCDGSRLKYTNGDAVLTSNGNDFINTPNLKGRVIVGANPTVDTANGLSVRNMNNIGGAETHTLTVPEMPTHNHNMSNDLGSFPRSAGYDFGVATSSMHPTLNLPSFSNNYKDILGFFNIKSAGESKPHNNMQPFYVLNYIIKQPIKP